MPSTLARRLEPLLRQASALLLFSLAGGMIAFVAVAPDPDDHRNDTFNPAHARACRFCRHCLPRPAPEPTLASIE